MSAHSGELMSGTSLTFEPRLRGLLGRGWDSFIRDYSRTVLEVAWAGLLVRGCTWSLRRGLQRCWYHCDVKTFSWYSYCGSGVYLGCSSLHIPSSGASILCFFQHKLAGRRENRRAAIMSLRTCEDLVFSIQSFVAPYGRFVAHLSLPRQSYH